MSRKRRKKTTAVDQKTTRQERANRESGKAGWLLLWLLGIPLPVLLIAYLILR